MTDEQGTVKAIPQLIFHKTLAILEQRGLSQNKVVSLCNVLAAV